MLEERSWKDPVESTEKLKGSRMPEVLATPWNRVLTPKSEDTFFFFFTFLIVSAALKWLPEWAVIRLL